MAEEKQLVVKLALKAGGYQQEIKSINQDTKVLKSEFEKAKAGAENFESSLEGQKAKLKVVSGELQNTESKLKIYNTQLKKCEDVLEQSTKAFEEQEKEVSSLKAQIQDYSNAYGATSNVVKKLEGDLKNSEKALESKRKAVISADSSLKGMQITVNKTEGDISKLKSEISKTENELKSIKDGTDVATIGMNDFKSGSYKAAEGVESLAEKLDDATGEVVEFGAHMSEIGQGVVVVGDKVGELGESITGALKGTVDAANSFKSNLNDIQAKTGATAEEMEMLSDVVESVYNNNFGESFEDAATSVSTVNKYLWLTGEELQRATEKAIGIRDTFGYDVAESVRSVDALMKHFGINADEAFNLIVQGSQNGLDFSGEMLDTINEYSVQFAKAGFSATDMFNILYDGTQTGAWNLDKIGDAVKEFNIRLTDGSQSSIDALKELGFNADNVAQSMANGGEGAKKTYQDVINKIVDMDDKQQQNLVGTALFGTMWEDLGPTVVGELSFIGDNFNKTLNSAEKLNEVKYDDFGSALEGVKRNVETGLIKPIGDSLLPTLNDFIPKISSIVEGLKGWIEENPKLVSGIVIIIGIIGGLLAILGPIITTIGMLVISLGAMSTAFAAAGGIAAFFSASILPIVATIGVVIGVIAALGMAIYSNWEGIKGATIQLIETCKPQFEALRNAFSNLWLTAQSIYTTVIKPLFNMIGQVIQYCIEFVTPILQRLIPVFTSVFNFISSFWNGIGRPVFSAIISIIQTLGNIVKPIFDTFKNVICGAMDAVLTPIQWVIDKLSSLLNWIGDAGSKVGGFLSKINPFKSVDINTVQQVKHFQVPQTAGMFRAMPMAMSLDSVALSGSYYQPQTIASKSIGGMIQSSNGFAKAINGFSGPDINNNSSSNFDMKSMEDMFGKMIDLLSLQNNLIEQNKPVFNIDGDELSNKLDEIGGRNMKLYGRFN